MKVDDHESDDSDSTGQRDNHAQPGSGVEGRPAGSAEAQPGTQGQADGWLADDAGNGDSEGDIEDAIGRQVLQLVERTIRTGYSGPIPPPRQLQEYDKAFPGLADKIIDAGIVAPQRSDDVAVREEVAAFKRGQVAAIVLAAVFTSAAIVSVLLGKVAGLVFLVPVVTQLILGFAPWARNHD